MIEVLEPKDLKVGDILVKKGPDIVEVIALGTKHVIIQNLKLEELVLTQNDLVDYDKVKVSVITTKI